MATKNQQVTKRKSGPRNAVEPKLYLYEVGIPMRETWVFRVHALNSRHARQLAKRGSDIHGNSCEQVCSTTERAFVRRLKQVGA